MAKIGVFKKITALVAAIALVVCFAVSAGAVEVLTTTSYSGSDISVSAKVTGVAEGANVTYYAYNGSNPVHIDQDKADETQSVTFNFTTVEAYLKSAVKVGVTNVDEATEGYDIKGYTVSYEGGSKVVPTEGGTIVIPAGVEDGFEYDGITVTGDATVVDTYSATDDTVSLAISGITEDITVSVKYAEIEKEETTATSSLLEAAAVVSTGKEDGLLSGGTWEGDKYVDGSDATTDKDIYAAEGSALITVIGRATNASEFGIILDTAAVESKTYTASEFAAFADKTYAAVEKTANNTFAVQLVDSGEGTFIAKDTDYYVAVYSVDAVTGEVVVNASDVPYNAN